MGCQGQCATGLQVSLTHALIAYHHTWFWSSEKITFSTVWNIYGINGRQRRVRHCSWREAKRRCQPTFVWFSTGTGSVEVAGGTQRCWPRLLGRRSFLIGVPACCAQSYEEIGQVLDMLVDALGQVGFVLNGAKYFLRRRANIQQYFHLQAW